MKVQLSEIDRRLIERVCNIVAEQTGIDDDNWIEIDDLLAILDSLEDHYRDLEDYYKEAAEEMKESYKPCDVNDNWRFYESTIEALQAEINKQHRFIKEKGLIGEYEKYNS